MIALSEMMEAVAARLLGEPNTRLSTDAEWRFGANGSLAVRIGGPHKGTWRSHEEGRGGGVLDLIAFKLGGDRAAAVAWLRENFPDTAGAPEPGHGNRRTVAVYPYHDELGALLYEVVRLEPKEFRQRRPDGRGGHIWNIKGASPVPYHLPELVEAVAMDRPVFVVEGEKDVDRLRALGLDATCNSGGAGKWPAGFSRWLSGARVVVVPDNDDAGRAHATLIAQSLRGTAAEVRLLDLPGLPRKGDVSDWLDAGGTADELHRLAVSAPSWRPASAARLPAVWYGAEDAHPPLTWLVRGLLVDGGLSAVFGGPGTSKTFFVLDLALHIAHGRPWFGRRVTGGGVVYVSGEGGAGVIQRMRAWRQERGSEPRAPFVLIPTSINLFDADEAGADALVADVRAHADTMACPCRLIVLDTLSRMIGSGDEDKARDINIVVHQAERIQCETGAHVLIVHHSGKDRDRGMRGSNALLAAVDAAVEVAKHETGLCEATIAKVKDGGSDAEPIRYRLSQSVLGTDADGDEITSCVVSPVDASEGPPKGAGSRLNPPERIALDALGDAIGTGGTFRPGHHVPANVPGVPADVWREYARKRGGLSGSEKPEAQRKAFQRVRDRLQALGLIGEWDGFVWIVPKP